MGWESAAQTRLRRDGFVILRQVLAVELVAPMRHAIFHAIEAREVARAKGTSQDVFRLRRPDALPATNAFAAGFAEPLLASAPFAAIAADVCARVLPSILGGAARISRARGARWLRIGWPHRSAPRYGPHQDVAYVAEPERFVVAWVPLHDTPSNLGGLRLVPRSHRRGVFEHEGRNGIAVRGAGLVWRRPSYRVGDVVVFDDHLIHSSGYNRTADRLRASIDFRAVRVSSSRRATTPRRAP